MPIFFERVAEDPHTILFVLCTVLIFFILSCVAIIDVGLKDFGGIGRKALWGFIAFIPFIGFVIYFFGGRKKGIRTKTNNL